MYFYLKLLKLYLITFFSSCSTGRLYALQSGLKLSTKTAEETNFLLALMTWLEETKKSMSDNEAITNDIAAQAHIENWTLKLFLFADKNDRAANFSKSVIQSFYTSGLLFDVMTVFGELSEEHVQNRKYAKWKAAYIHNCLKNGETPKPGPLDEAEGDNDNNEPTDEQSKVHFFTIIVFFGKLQFFLSLRYRSTTSAFLSLK